MNVDGASQSKGLHELLDLLLVIGFQDQYKSVLTIEYSISDDFDTKFTGIQRADMPQELVAHLGVARRAGFSSMLVVDIVERYFELLWSGKVTRKLVAIWIQAPFHLITRYLVTQLLVYFLL